MTTKATQTKPPKDLKHIDRLKYAAELVKGKRVLDIGGQKMLGAKGHFVVEYSKIHLASEEYCIVDCQNVDSVDYVINLNKPDSIGEIEKIIDDYKPQVILCMELLEHINYRTELMAQLARSIDKYDTKIFITIPNNGNWVLNFLGWNWDHSVAFLKDVAYRFVVRSELGQHKITMFKCTGTYVWYWWVIYLTAFLQPLSFGFLVESKGDNQ